MLRPGRYGVPGSGSLLLCHTLNQKQGVDALDRGRTEGLIPAEIAVAGETTLDAAAEAGIGRDSVLASFQRGDRAVRRCEVSIRIGDLIETDPDGGHFTVTELAAPGDAVRPIGKKPAAENLASL